LGEKRLTSTARTLRRDMTEAERKLWARLRNRQIDKVKFVKQLPVGPFVADFAARSLGLIIEASRVCWRLLSVRRSYNEQRKKQVFA